MSASTMILHIVAHICLKAPRPSWWFRANHLALPGTRRRPSQTVNSHDRSVRVSKVCTESLVHAARACILGSHVERASQHTTY